MRIAFIILISVLFLSTPVYSEEEGNAKSLQIPVSQEQLPSLLVDTGWLIEHIEDGLTLLDARNLKSYIEGHIPGAIPVDVEVFTPDFLKPPSKKDLEEIIGSYGINDETAVVIYDEGNGLYASLIFWLLDYAGFKNIAILNGGFKKWEEDGHPLEKEIRAAAAASFVLSLRSEVFVDAEWILKNKDNPLVILIDVRSPAEYSGIISPNARAGHLPGAKNIPWTKNLELDGRIFRDLQELKRLYELYDVTSNRTIIIYSQTLLRATHTFFSLKVLGYKDIRLLRSFKEWADRAYLPLENEE